MPVFGADAATDAGTMSWTITFDRGSRARNVLASAPSGWLRLKCRLPSPTWPKATTRTPGSAASPPRWLGDESAMRVTGTEMSCLMLRLRASGPRTWPSRMRQSAARCALGLRRWRASCDQVASSAAASSPPARSQRPRTGRCRRAPAARTRDAAGQRIATPGMCCSARSRPMRGISSKRSQRSPLRLGAATAAPWRRSATRSATKAVAHARGSGKASAPRR